MERIKLLYGSLMYSDSRLEGFDAATVVEVMEHLAPPPQLSALERVLFEFARPKTVVMTTPNVEYNVMWESQPAEKFRHPDHRFEWTRQQFQEWAQAVAAKHQYTVRFLPIGPPWSYVNVVRIPEAGNMLRITDIGVRSSSAIEIIGASFSGMYYFLHPEGA